MIKSAFKATWESDPNAQEYKQRVALNTLVKDIRKLLERAVERVLRLRRSDSWEEDDDARLARAAWARASDLWEGLGKELSDVEYDAFVCLAEVQLARAYVGQYGDEASRPHVYMGRLGNPGAVPGPSAAELGADREAAATEQLKKLLPIVQVQSAMRKAKEHREAERLNAEREAALAALLT